MCPITSCMCWRWDRLWWAKWNAKARTIYTYLCCLYLNNLVAFVVDACQKVINQSYWLVMVELRAEACPRVAKLTLAAGMGNNYGEWEGKRARKKKENWYALYWNELGCKCLQKTWLPVGLEKDIRHFLKDMSAMLRDMLQRHYDVIMIWGSRMSLKMWLWRHVFKMSY